MTRWEVFFDLASKKKRLEEIANEAAQPDFWNNTDKAQEVLKERSLLTTQVEGAEGLIRAVEDCGALFELSQEAQDESLLEECAQEITKTEAVLQEYEMTRMLSGEHDRNNAVLEINSGAGGTEAQDWCEMLLRMYLRWAEKKGFKAEILSIHAGE